MTDFTVVDLGFPDELGNNAVGYCINASGQVGGSSNGNYADSQAVRWDSPGVAVVLEPLVGEAAALGISDAGVCVGRADDGGANPHPTKWSAAGARTDLGYLNGGDTYGIAWAIGALGHPVGQSGPNSNSQKPVIWKPAATDLGSIGADTGPLNAATAVNSVDDITGGSYIGAAGKTVLWPLAGPIVALDPQNSQGLGINEARDIVGWTVPAAVGVGTIWPAAGAAVELPPMPGGTFSLAYDINNNGWICGGGNDAGFGTRATVWIDRVAQGLPFLSGGSVSWAYAMNDAGQIVGYCNDGAGAFHAVMWQPVSNLPGYAHVGLP